MSEKAWAWILWGIGFVVLGLLAIPTLGFTLVFLWAWWVGGPLYFDKEGDFAPFWRPIQPQRLWWRDIR